MTYDYDGLRNHLLRTHQNLAAPNLGDGEAVQQHHHEHFGPGGLRNHLHHDTLPPASWPEIPLLPAAVDDPYLTVVEIATRFRVSKMTVYRLVHTGELQAVKIGRSFRVRESAVTTYLKEGPNA